MTDAKVGNAAKMREALEQILHGEYKDRCEVTLIAGAALAEPPRNCDVGTAGEQAERFGEFCLENHSAEKLCSKCCLGERLGNNVDVCQIHWAQMPYENNEKKEVLPLCACGGEAAIVERGTEPEGFAIMCSRCFRKTALRPTLTLAEEEWRTMLATDNTTTKENK